MNTLTLRQLHSSVLSSSSSISRSHLASPRHRQLLVFSSTRFFSHSYPSLQHRTTQSPQKSQDDIPPPIIPGPPKKKTTDFHPAPIKPLKPPAKTVQPPTTQELNNTSALPSSLQAAKQHAQEDIQLAQSHGVLKPPPADAVWFRKLIHQGWELAKFYGRGVKLVWQHRAIVAQIKSRANKGGPPITRAEHRFIETFYQDVKKLIPFIIIALLLEEIIPLIALYVPSMLPSTCILPSQRDRIRQTKLAKATVYSDEFRAAIQRMSQKPANFMLHRDDALVMCGVLRIPTWGPNVLKKRRISNYLAGIAQDDIRLLGENRGTNLNDGELTEALEERGFIVPLNAPKTKQQEMLRWWLARVENTADADAIPWRISSSAAAVIRA